MPHNVRAMQFDSGEACERVHWKEAVQSGADLQEKFAVAAVKKNGLPVGARGDGEGLAAIGWRRGNDWALEFLHGAESSRDVAHAGRVVDAQRPRKPAEQGRAEERQKVLARHLGYNDAQLLNG